MDRNEYNRYDSGNYNDEEDDNYDQDTQTTSPSGRGDSRQQLSSHGQASSHSRLKVTNEGLLDPDLLSRTEGYMYKKGGAVNQRGGFRNWKKRWFTISEVDFLGSLGYELRYFDAPKGKLKGTIGLSEIELFMKETSKEGKRGRHEFQILLQTGGTLELSCDDFEERAEWMDTLNMIIAYHRKILTSSSMTLDGYDPLLDDDEEIYRIGADIAQNCQAYGPALFGSEAGQQSHLIVQVYDSTGQQVTRGGMPLTATLESADCLYYLRLLDNSDGSYFAQYMVGRAGKYQLSICLNDEHHICGSPFEVEVLPSRTLARYCTASGSVLQSVKLNSTETFMIQAMDGYGNKKVKGGDPFEVAVMGSAQLKDLVDHGDGTYTCTVQASGGSVAHSSSLMITITLLGKPIAGSPFKPVIVDYDNSATQAPNKGQQSGKKKAPRSTSLPPTPLSALESLEQPSQPPLPPLPSQQDPMPQSTTPARQQQLQPPSTEVESASIASKTPVAATATIAKSSAMHSPATLSSRTAASPVPLTSPTTPGSAAGSSLSRLERSRQRAMLAKSLAEGTATIPKSSPSVVTASPPVFATPGRVGAAAFSSPSPTLQSRSEPFASMGGAITLKQSMNRDQIAVLTESLRQGLGSSDGNKGGPPSNSTPNELKIWDNTHRALSSEGVLKLLSMHLNMLQLVFDLFAGPVEGAMAAAQPLQQLQVIKLNSTNNDRFKSSTAGGVLRLLELYDVLPTYLSKVEAKVLFSLAVHAQRNLRSPASVAGGGTGLDLAGFLKLMVMASYHCLSKTSSYSSLYSTIESKVEVMLYKWGLADELKLQVVSSSLQSSTA